MTNACNHDFQLLAFHIGGFTVMIFFFIVKFNHIQKIRAECKLMQMPNSALRRSTLHCQVPNVGTACRSLSSSVVDQLSSMSVSQNLNLQKQFNCSFRFYTAYFFGSCRSSQFFLPTMLHMDTISFYWLQEKIAHEVPDDTIMTYQITYMRYQMTWLQPTK